MRKSERNCENKEEGREKEAVIEAACSDTRTLFLRDVQLSAVIIKPSLLDYYRSTSETMIIITAGT